MRIRRVRPEEYEEAGEVTALAYAEFGPSTSGNEQVRADDDWLAYFDVIRDIGARDAKAEVWVVEGDDGALLGTLTLELDQRTSDTARPLEPGEAYIRMLGIHPDARHLGAGRALMNHAIARSRQEGKTKLTLNSTNLMVPAQRLYESLGFELYLEETFEDDDLVLLYYELDL